MHYNRVKPEKLFITLFYLSSLFFFKNTGDEIAGDKRIYNALFKLFLIKDQLAIAVSRFLYSQQEPGLRLDRTFTIFRLGHETKFRKSSHIRLLMFSPKPVSEVLVTIDEGSEERSVQDKSLSNLYTLAWNQDKYNKIHTINIKVTQSFCLLVLRIRIRNNSALRSRISNNLRIQRSGSEWLNITKKGK